MAELVVDSSGDVLTSGGEVVTWGGQLSVTNGLAPLAASHEADEVEAALKAVFMSVFENMIRTPLARVNFYGMPHRGDFQTVERFVKADGLALQRRTNAEAYMRELHRGWRARNPKRGLQFLRYYLQLLWPNSWTLVQMWQNPALPYPGGASETEAPGFIRTSRVRLYLEVAGDLDGTELSRVAGSLRAVVPARIVLEVMTRSTGSAGIRMAAAGDGTDLETINVNADTAAAAPPPSPPASSLLLFRFNGADGQTTGIVNSGSAGSATYAFQAGEGSLSSAAPQYGSACAGVQWGGASGGNALALLTSGVHLAAAQPFTIRCWVNRNGATTSTTNTGALYMLAAWEAYSGGPSFSLFLSGFTATSGAWKLNVTYDDGTNFADALFPLPPSGWSHVEAGFDGATVRVFIDGLIVASYAYDTTGSPGADTTGALEAIRGMGWPSSSDGVVLIDDFEVQRGVCLHTANFTPPGPL